jgi:hypothetical protein
MKKSKRTRLLTKAILKTNTAQQKVQEEFFMKAVRASTPRLERIVKNVRVEQRGKKIVY